MATARAGHLRPRRLSADLEPALLGSPGGMLGGNIQLDPTSVERTQFVNVQLASRFSFDRVDKAFEDAVLRNKTSLKKMRYWRDQLMDSRRPGISTIRDMLDLRATGMVPAQSELGRHLLDLLDHP